MMSSGGEGKREETGVEKELELDGMVGGVDVSWERIERFGGSDGDEGCNVGVGGDGGDSGSDPLLCHNRGAFSSGEDEHGRKAKPNLPMVLSSRHLDRILTFFCSTKSLSIIRSWCRSDRSVLRLAAEPKSGGLDLDLLLPTITSIALSIKEPISG